MARRRRPPVSMLERFARTEIATGGLLTLQLLEGLARWAYERACLPEFLPDPLWIVERLGVRHRRGRVPGTSRAILRYDDRGAVIVHRQGSVRRVGLDVLHELAHWILNRLLRDAHNHADVWLLTLCLAFTIDDLYRVRREGWTTRVLARHQAHVEHWALRLRLEVARFLYDGDSVVIPTITAG